MAQTLSSIQQSARGVAEWIDGQATGAGSPPVFAHDHRGGVWGRPLGVGFSCPTVLLYDGLANLGCETFCNVPDPRAISGDLLANAELNGGYTFVDVHVYATAPIAAAVKLTFSVSTWSNDQWGNETAQDIDLTIAGVGAQWVKLPEGLHLPPGLVRIKAQDNGGANNWQWVSFVVPQR
tara:strand:+ start:1441 stop:1977 length:537 start_codon:yes stop_codon:yes gene_type:complete